MSALRTLASHLIVNGENENGGARLEFASVVDYGIAATAEVFTRGFSDYLVTIAASEASLLQAARSDSVDLAASRVDVMIGEPRQPADEARGNEVKAAVDRLILTVPVAPCALTRTSSIHWRSAWCCWSGLLPTWIASTSCTSTSIIRSTATCGGSTRRCGNQR